TFKLLAAGILLASGLGLGLGTGGLPTAEAQQPGLPPGSKVEVRDYEFKPDLSAEYARVLGLPTKDEAPTARTKKSDYDFVEASDLSQTKFVASLQDREDRGWEFIGSSRMPVNGHPSNVWIFRRPRTGTGLQLQGTVDTGTVEGLKGTKSPYANPPDHPGR